LNEQSVQALTAIGITLNSISGFERANWPCLYCHWHITEFLLQVLNEQTVQALTAIGITLNSISGFERANWLGFYCPWHITEFLIQVLNEQTVQVFPATGIPLNSFLLIEVSVMQRRLKTDDSKLGQLNLPTRKGIP
jgi:hypothetical protein